MNNSKKIVLIGHFGVGKSSLVRRYVQNTFTDNYMVTIGVHIVKKEVQFNQKSITLIIWDIEGKDDIKKVRASYLIGTSGFIYVVDPTRPQTYEHITSEINFITTQYPKAKYLTVANKSDLIEPEEIKRLFDSLQIKIDYFASAKSGDEVSSVFENLAQQLLDNV